MSEQYNKLVRDKIPEIIEKSGKKAITRILNDEEYKKELDKKLIEEVNEYIKDDTLEELGDIVEVVLAILKSRGSNLGELVEITDEKNEQRGGFDKKIFLEEVK